MDLWSRKRPLYQRSHNHCPKLFYFANFAKLFMTSTALGASFWGAVFQGRDKIYFGNHCDWRLPVQIGWRRRRNRRISTHRMADAEKVQLGAAIAQWIRLRLPSCCNGFESQAHHLCFHQFIELCNVEKTKININISPFKKRKSTIILLMLLI